VIPPTTPSPHDTHHDIVVEAMPLVGHIVRGALARVPRHVDDEDLVGAGLAALVAAAHAFDASRGASFQTYATNRIRGAVIDELRRCDWASRSVRRRARDLEKTREIFTNQLGRQPTDTELAAGLGVGLSEVRKLREDLARAVLVSLDGFSDGREGTDPATTATPLDVLEHREQLAYLRDAVAELPDRLRMVVEGSFFDGRRMADLATELGVTESRVSQMRTEALVLVREALERSLQPDVRACQTPSAGRGQRREAYFAAVAGRSTFRERVSGCRRTERPSAAG
jgi:RNA polymerase sigma factor for flagellar operon FliA